jgi:hypothetical protein
VWGIADSQDSLGGGSKQSYIIGLKEFQGRLEDPIVGSFQVDSGQLIEKTFGFVGSEGPGGGTAGVEIQFLELVGSIRRWWAQSNGDGSF